MKQKFNGKLLAKDILAKRTKDNLSFGKIQADTDGALTKANLYRLEANVQVPNADMLAAVCNWLGKSISTYF